MLKFFRYSCFGMSVFFLAACEQYQFPELSALTSLKSSLGDAKENSKASRQSLELAALIDGSLTKVNVDLGFAETMFEAIDQDPNVRAAKNELSVAKANLRLTEASGDTKVEATALGGVEDITDETVGVAAILTANRMLYDGGILEAKIEADRFYIKAMEQAYQVVRGKRALSLAHAWIELEHYKQLKDLINSRMEVLDPLLVQLESVASAGVGDVSQVASAKRIVSSIVVAQTDVDGRYEQAKIAYINGFGRLPVEAKYDADWMSSSAPHSSTRKLVEKSSAVLSQYWSYRAAEASVVAVQAQGDFRLGFQLKVQKPLGGSNLNSDESIGLVLSKDLYQVDQIKSQVDRAEATARAKADQVLSAFKESEFSILAARELIKTMDTAIQIARSNAKSSREEIAYLKKQLIIGGSTLETVLSAEARLYDAESKEIYFAAERLKNIALVTAFSGHFSSSP